MEEKTNSSAKKRNLALILSAVAAVAILAIVIIALSVRPKSSLEVKPSKSTSVSTSSFDQPSSSDQPDSSEPDEPDEPTVKPIVFDMPVEGGVVFNEYTDAIVTFNKTLGIYTGHMGIDISGAEGAKVKAAYDGTIKEITTTYLEGTTVVIDHGNGLYSVYNSIDALSTLQAGQKINKGDELGVISTSNRQEYKDGAHLHFEVRENDKTVDPYKYLAVSGK